MKASPEARVLPFRRRNGFSIASAGPQACVSADPDAAVRRAIARTRRWLLGCQHPDGYWVAELEGDTILESETILLLAFLGREDSELARRAAGHLVDQQLAEGGWGMYPGGGVELSASVKAYFALKLVGYDLGCPCIERARRAILAHGGADAVNSFTRFYLAILGQISYHQCPEVPPEVVLLPKWFPVNLYAVSAWSRTIIVPLSIVSALRPVREVGPQRGIRELFLKSPEDWPLPRPPGMAEKSRPLGWDGFFRTVDRALKWCRRWGLLPLRRRALDAALQWMLDRFQDSDGLGAIFPPIVWSLVALRALGYDDDSPPVAYCRGQLEDLVTREHASGNLKIQPCKSPVWDTAITLRALHAGGVGPENPAMVRAVGWLLEQQIMRRGDWAESVDAEPGGWCFEHRNGFYPDADDTAMVLTALAEQRSGEGPPPEGLPPEVRIVGLAGLDPHYTLDPADKLPSREQVAGRAAGAIERGLKWLLAMQNDDGGWGAFDRNNNRRFLCHVPFADHNAMIDPSTPDVTGRVLECLGKSGFRLPYPVVQRAVDYLRRTQEPDGSWFGRWGVNYIYGTWQVLTGLRQVDVPAQDPAVAAGVNWLLACQQSGGGWGESPETYANPALRGQGPATASQTAWAVLGLLASERADDPATRRGIQFLLETQQPDGTWGESEFTGTGFPRVFYLRYHFYPIYFPLMALSRWAVMTTTSPTAAAKPPLRVVHQADRRALRRPSVAPGTAVGTRDAL